MRAFGTFIALGLLASVHDASSSPHPRLTKRQLIVPFSPELIDPALQSASRLLAIHNSCPYTVYYAVAAPSSNTTSTSTTTPTTTLSSPVRVKPSSTHWLPLLAHPSTGTAVKLARTPSIAAGAPVSQFEFFANASAPLPPTYTSTKTPTHRDDSIDKAVLDAVRAPRLFYDLSNVDCGSGDAVGEEGACPFWGKGMRVDVRKMSSVGLESAKESVRKGTAPLVEEEQGKGVCPSLEMAPLQLKSEDVFLDSGDAHAMRSCDEDDVVVVWELCKSEDPLHGKEM